jgi:uncharacterized coiled-coil protein SlyX
MSKIDEIRERAATDALALGIALNDDDIKKLSDWMLQHHRDTTTLLAHIDKLEAREKLDQDVIEELEGELKATQHFIDRTAELEAENQRLLEVLKECPECGCNISWFATQAQEADDA